MNLWINKPPFYRVYCILSKLDTYGKAVELGFLSEADFLQNMCTRQLFTIQAKTRGENQKGVSGISPTLQEGQNKHLP